MKQIVLLFFVLHLSQAYVNFEQCVLDHRSNKNIWEEKLHDKIMCIYYENKRPKPLNGSDALVVNIHFIVKSFRFLSKDQEFSVFTWATISWTDERLKWDPTDYDGIDETVKESYKLRVPGIKLYNSISDLYDQSRSNNAHPFMLCRINSSGKIICVYSVTFEAKCATDLNDWPFDTQVCSLEFGPWVVGTKIRLNVDHEGVSFIGSEYGGDWDIMDFSQEVNQDAERQIKFFFTMMRHSEGLAAIVIFPSILLSALTLSTLFVDVRHVSRVYVACFSLACHFYFLSELGMYIPEHSKRSPSILLYFRGSVIMTIISVVLTCLMKFLCEIEESVPYIIAIVNDNVYKTYAKLVIRPRWEAANDDGGKRELAEMWIDFVNILNSLWLYVSLFVYIIMCCVFIPSPSGLKHNVRSMSYEFE